MEYKINELSKLSGISTRTLRHYNEIGLLVPRRTDSNYRVYGKKEVDLLQTILIYKELGFALDDIKKMITKKEDEVKIFEKHLVSLKKNKERLQLIIDNVEKTIKYKKGETNMNDNDKFRGLKEKLIDDNDYNYKDEVIKKYGEDAYEKSRLQFANMTEPEFEDFTNMSNEIIDFLKRAIDLSEAASGEHAQKAAQMHQKWIKTAWGWYNKEAHLGLVDGYLLDERFIAYYDVKQKGSTKLLRDAVYYYLTNK